MGTGIVSLLLITIPYQARWLYWLSVIFFVLNTILFSLAFIISFLRYTLYPEIWGAMIKDATNSLFLGTVPIGFATLVEAWIFLCVPHWGPWATTFAWVMWMIDSIVAAGVTLSLGILMYVPKDPESLCFYIKLTHLQHFERLPDLSRQDYCSATIAHCCHNRCCRCRRRGC
jgi:tellurite resistance protein TehA-like permease